MRMNYKQYLHSEAWKRTRQQRLKISRFQCDHCASRDSLQVHHLTYSCLGRERMNQLMTLCRPCHELIEAHIQVIREHRPSGSMKGLKNFTHKFLRRYGRPHFGKPIQQLPRKQRKKYDAKKAVMAFREKRG
jgi:hypothetical protein